MLDADRVAAKLAEIRERSERPVCVTNLPISNDGVRSLMESAADVPVLLAVADAVLARHRPLHGDWGDMCSYCWTRGGSRRSWPCPEYLETAAALLGQEATDGS